MIMYLRSFILIGILISVIGCRQSQKENRIRPENISTQEDVKTDPLIKVKHDIDYNDAEWSELLEADSMILDIRYATENNFTKTQIYDCPRCFLRPEVAKRIRRINFHLHRKYNWRLKLFDCYRPRPYQQKLWDIVPNPIYVSDPSKGSMHNRGAAVDLTIVDIEGKELDMGTEFDHFGEEAHKDYTGLSDTILHNRQILDEIMVGNGFKGIQSEWWHYSISGLESELSEWIWECENSIPK